MNLDDDLPARAATARLPAADAGVIFARIVASPKTALPQALRASRPCGEVERRSRAADGPGQLRAALRGC